MNGVEPVLTCVSIVLAVVSIVTNAKAARVSEQARRKRLPIAILSGILVLFYVRALFVVPPISVSRALGWLGLIFAFVRPAVLEARSGRSAGDE